MIKTFNQIADYKVGNKHYFINHKICQTKVAIKDIVIISEQDKPLHSFANNSVDEFKMVTEWKEEIEKNGKVVETRNHVLREGFIRDNRFLVLVTNDRIGKALFTTLTPTVEEFIAL